MFAKLATLRNFDRALLRRAAAASTNSRPALRLVASSQYPRKPRLACHWRRPAGGGLECVWHAEAGDTRPAEELGIRSPVSIAPALKRRLMEPKCAADSAAKQELCHGAAAERTAAGTADVP